MHLSAEHCRKQQATQMLIAAGCALESRRVIALRAAAAWGVKALEADERAKGGPLSREALDAEIALEFALEDEAFALTGKIDSEAQPS